MTDSTSKQNSGSLSKAPVERLYPFAMRARVVVVGESSLSKVRKKLHFILVTRDLSEKRLPELLRAFTGIPVLRGYDSSAIEQHFGFKNTKMIGFKKSSLAVSIYRELKDQIEKLDAEAD